VNTNTAGWYFFRPKLSRQPQQSTDIASMSESQPSAKYRQWEDGASHGQRTAQSILRYGTFVEMISGCISGACVVLQR
jgi:hypothetical protein